MKKNIKMEIRSIEEENEGEEIKWDTEDVKIYKIGYMDKIRDNVKKIHWDEFLKRSFQEKIMIIIFFILIMFLISIFLLRSYWKKIK
jgi:hypothetical protein